MELTKEVAEFLTEKRTRKKEVRHKKKWLAAQAKREHQNESYATFGKRSKIIKMVADQYRSDGSAKKGRVELIVPKTFSIIDDPNSAIANLGNFAKSVYQTRTRSIFVNHQNLTTYDLAANGLLDVLAVELEHESNRTGRRIRWQGRYPKDRNIQRFIRAMGIVKHLKVEGQSPKADEAADLRLFDERNRHYYQHQPNQADMKARVVRRFADHVDACLLANNRTLTPEARHKLCVYTGEILDNAEQHAQMVDWTIQGYLDNSLDTPLCEIAIFNFGHTIADSLAALPKNSYTWNQISPYITQHRKFRFFGSTWSEDDLLTLIALQGHVSCKNETPQDTRGNGTVDLIEFFQQVYAECAPADSPMKPLMAIVSGSTYVLFDGKYKLTERKGGGKIITFNDENDLSARPDPKYVCGLKGHRFPGTVISVRFPLTTASTIPLHPQDPPSPHA